jgi:hypothetical protein
MARLTGLLLLALLVAACTSPVFAPDGSEIPTVTGKPQPEDRIHAQAHDALARWADAVRQNGGASISFVGELTSQIGAWEAAVEANNKVALAAGQVVPRGELPAERPGRREVKWVDGTKLDTEVLSASAALLALVSDIDQADCDGCEPIVVTEANLATGLVETSTGPAEVPMWVYAVAGSVVRITRVAVDGGVTVRPPPWDASDPPLGISIDLAVGTPDSDSLEVHFVGADDSCGLEYEAEAVESELAVVIIVMTRPGEDVDGCRLIGRLRTATVTLDAPLGNRAVLEVRQGLPVPVQAPSEAAP